MIQIAVWLGTLWGRVAIVGSVVVALIGLRAWDVSTQQAKGATRVVAKIEKATDNASKLGKRAADRSTAPGVRGQRDPTSRDD
jgi:hypothetical protein